MNSARPINWAVSPLNKSLIRLIKMLSGRYLATANCRTWIAAVATDGVLFTENIYGVSHYIIRSMSVRRVILVLSEQSQPPQRNLAWGP